jgi:hypothetical protein
MCLLLTASSLSAQGIPHTEAETLSGTKIVLPDAAAGHPAIFIIGFSRGGGDASGRWTKELRKEFADNRDLRLYSIAVLQDAPRMMRGMIKHGMRESIPKSEQQSFVILEHDEDTWKKLADFSDPNDAYVMLGDSTGTIRWRAHARAPDAKTINALRSALAKKTGTDGTFPKLGHS